MLRNYPRLIFAEISGADGLKDGVEGVGAGSQTGRVDDGADVGFALCGPHGAIAVRDLALDDGGPKSALAGVVGRLHQSGPLREGQKLISGPPEFALNIAGQIA